MYSIDSDECIYEGGGDVAVCRREARVSRNGSV